MGSLSHSPATPRPKSSYSGIPSAVALEVQRAFKSCKYLSQTSGQRFPFGISYSQLDLKNSVFLLRVDGFGQIHTQTAGTTGEKRCKGEGKPPTDAVRG